MLSFTCSAMTSTACLIRSVPSSVVPCIVSAKRLKAGLSGAVEQALPGPQDGLAVGPGADPRLQDVERRRLDLGGQPQGLLGPGHGQGDELAPDPLADVGEGRGRFDPGPEGADKRLLSGAGGVQPEAGRLFRLGLEVASVATPALRCGGGHSSLLLFLVFPR